MKIIRLNLSGFRNLKDVEFFTDEGINVIYGENGQGKTNIIEAIWLFTGFKSFRTRKNSEMIPYDEEKYEIRGHVKLGADKIDFVPEKYRSVFLDAILMHHENMDGSGYPAGIGGEQIPLIARIIHVVESFIALISRRNYRGIFDKESAIKELRARPNFYDQKIVDVLDSLV